MGVLTLNIEFRERGIKKTMQFEPRIVVYDACRLIRDKLGPLNDNRNFFLNIVVLIFFSQSLRSISC